MVIAFQEATHDLFRAPLTRGRKGLITILVPSFLVIALFFYRELGKYMQAMVIPQTYHSQPMVWYPLSLRQLLT